MGSSASTAVKCDDTREGYGKGEASPLPVLIHSPLLSCFSILYSPFSALFSTLRADSRRNTSDALKIMAADRSAPNPRTTSEPGDVGMPRCFCPHAKPCPALPHISTKQPRFANRLDIPRITEILLAALLQDPFYIYLWKHREDFPNDHRFYWEHRMFGDLFNPRYVFLVLELESQRADTTGSWVEAKGSPIISFAIWERKGNSEGALKWESERKEECGVNHSLSVINDVHLKHDFPGLRRDTTPERFNACKASLQQTDDDFSAILSPDRLQMELICTYPCYQRRGAASQLVQWGLQRAIEDELRFVTAAASFCGKGLYQKNGFRYLEGHQRRVVKVENEDDETDYALMVWRNSKWKNG
ncbi:MAG: hypothetical protein M1840_007051 [Geoglossum simile]|nr:MAG: hypothetical protein M1840_007051 [Geoglossum simile]